MEQTLLALAFGMVVGLSLGLIGGSGSILTVPILVYALGTSVHLATGTSLVIAGAIRSECSGWPTTRAPSMR